jgi:hypothetical protein
MENHSGRDAPSLCFPGRSWLGQPGLERGDPRIIPGNDPMPTNSLLPPGQDRDGSLQPGLPTVAVGVATHLTAVAVSKASSLLGVGVSRKDRKQ